MIAFLHAQAGRAGCTKDQLLSTCQTQTNFQVTHLIAASFRNSSSTALNESRIWRFISLSKFFTSPGPHK